MIEHPLTPRTMTWIAVLMTGMLLQACAPQPGRTASGARVYAADLTGQSKTCEVPKLSPVPGQTTDTAIKLDNDGGWCGLPLQQPDAKPFEAGLLSARPSHGSVMIHQVGDDTRVDYTPDRGFTGNDSFAVTLIPGEAVIRISVSVVAASPAAPERPTASEQAVLALPIAAT